LDSYDPEAAAKYYAKAQALAPTDLHHRIRSAANLWRCDKNEQAEEELLEALEIEPDNMDFLYAAADYYLKRGRLSQAKRMAETMVEKHPSNRLGHDLLGLIKRKEKKKGRSSF